MTVVAKLIKRVSVDNPFSYSRWDTIQVHIFEDREGRKYVWKTNTWPSIEAGNIYKFEGNFKEEKEYKGEMETILTRCRNFELVEEMKKVKIPVLTRQDQMKTLQDGDELVTMPYSRFKQHYSDCEKLVGSFEAHGCGQGAEMLITVIVRKGRMKPSGSRGKHYSYFRYEKPDGFYLDIKAISKDTADKRVPKGSKLIGRGYPTGHHGFYCIEKLEDGQ